MSARGRELVTADEATVVTESLFDAVVVENGESDGCLADSTDTNESDGREVFSQTNDLLDQLVTSETGPRRRGRWFTKGARCGCKILDLPTTECANLVWVWVTVNLRSMVDVVEVSLTN